MREKEKDEKAFSRRYGVLLRQVANADARLADEILRCLANCNHHVLIPTWYHRWEFRNRHGVIISEDEFRRAKLWFLGQNPDDGDFILDYMWDHCEEVFSEDNDDLIAGEVYVPGKGWQKPTKRKRSK
jgi:hypothetical protein